LLISTEMCLAKGETYFVFSSVCCTKLFSILEYLSKEEADRAVKDLDGRELRGKVVRVALDDSVGQVFFVSGHLYSNSTIAAWS
jgi:hypothetical protein